MDANDNNTSSGGSSSGGSVTTKEYHCFLSYRVATDAALAERVCDKLQQLELLRERNLRVKVFLDKQNLKAGLDYEAGFKNAISASCLFLPLVSEGFLETIAKLEQGKEDPVLVEYETALKLQDENNIDIIPLFIGSQSKVGDEVVYKRFNGFSMKFPEHASGTNPSGTIKGTMEAMFKFQGIFVNPEELPDKLQVVLERLSNVVWPKFRSHWHNVDELGVEEMFTCVQCGLAYLESQNGPGHCSYHEKSDGYRYNCCGELVGKEKTVTTSTVAAGVNSYGQKSMANPSAAMQSQTQMASGCRRAKHASEHHQRFPYLKFSDWAYGILGQYTMHEEWSAVDCYDFAQKNSFHFAVGVCLHSHDRGKIYVKVGWVTEFFELFSKKKLKDMMDAPPESRKKSFTPLKNCTASIEWLCDDKFEINGLLYKAKPSSSAEHEHKYIFKFPDAGSDTDLPTLVSHEVIQSGEFEEYGPSQDYDVPKEIWCKGPTLHYFEPRPPETEFKSVGTLAVRLKLLEKVGCNVDRQFDAGDMFKIVVSVISLAEKPITVVDVTGKWVLRGAPDQEWKTINSVKVSNTECPFKLDAGGTQRLEIMALVEDPKKKISGNNNWWAKSFVAREHSMLLFLTIEATTGETVSQLYEFVNPHSGLTSSDSSDVHFVPVDDAETYHREAVRVRKPDDGVFGIQIPGYSFKYSENDLRSLVYQALESKVSSKEIVNDKGFQVEVLIDDACRRVFALKVTAKSSTTTTLALLSVPLYGNTSKKRDASQNAAKSSLQKLIPSDFVVLDTSVKSYPKSPIPDLPISNQQPAPSAGGGGGSGGASVNNDAILKTLKEMEVRLLEHVDVRFIKLEKYLDETIKKRLDDLEKRLSGGEAEDGGTSSSSSASVDSGKNLKGWIPKNPFIPKKKE